MVERYLLDTSALVALLLDEPGASTVQDLLRAAGKAEASVSSASATVTVLCYLLWQREGESAAKAVMIDVRALPVKVIDTHERLALRAARLKALYRVSFADAVIAATAMECDAILVHKDPEYSELINEVRQLVLPLKKSSKK